MFVSQGYPLLLVQLNYISLKYIDFVERRKILKLLQVMPSGYIGDLLAICWGRFQRVAQPFF